MVADFLPSLHNLWYVFLVQSHFWQHYEENSTCPSCTNLHFVIWTLRRNCMWGWRIEEESNPWPQQPWELNLSSGLPVLNGGLDQMSSLTSRSLDAVSTPLWLCYPLLAKTCLWLWMLRSGYEYLENSRQRCSSVFLLIQPLSVFSTHLSSLRPICLTVPVSSPDLFSLFCQFCIYQSDSRLFPRFQWQASWKNSNNGYLFSSHNALGVVLNAFQT